MRPALERDRDRLTSIDHNAPSSPVALTTTAPTQNVGLMKQVLFYHFVTGTGGVKRTFTTAGLRPGMKLDTMYVSTSTKKPYQLAVGERDGKIQIKSVGTTAYIVRSNVRCGAGYAHIINNVLVPMSLSSIPRF